MKDAIDTGNIVAINGSPVFELDSSRDDFDIPEDLVRRFADSMGWYGDESQPAHATGGGRH